MALYGTALSFNVSFSLFLTFNSFLNLVVSLIGYCEIITEELSSTNTSE